METYDYINQVNASVVDLQGYVDHTLLLSLLCITMILRVHRNFFEITTKPYIVYGGPVPSTHLNHADPPPKIVKNEDFDSWVYRFKRHLNHVNINIWRIIEEGFYPHDPSNFTPREAANNQFNENALFIIQDAIPPEDLPHLPPFALAKDA